MFLSITIDILTLLIWSLLGGESQRKSELGDCSLKHSWSEKSKGLPCHTRLMIHWFNRYANSQLGVVW